MKLKLERILLKVKFERSIAYHLQIKRPCKLEKMVNEIINRGIFLVVFYGSIALVFDHALFLSSDKKKMVYW